MPSRGSEAHTACCVCECVGSQSTYGNSSGSAQERPNKTQKEQTFTVRNDHDNPALNLALPLLNRPLGAPQNSGEVGMGIISFPVDEETLSERAGNLPTGTQLVSGGLPDPHTLEAGVSAVDAS